LDQSHGGFSQRHRESYLSAISVGLFLLLIGVFFVATPNLYDKTGEFFTGFNVTTPVTSSQWNITLPAPMHPETHSVVYLAVEQFSFAWGIFLVSLLALRLVLRSPLRKKAENVSDIVSWLGAGYLVSIYLNETTKTTTWFTFWAAIIVLIGVSLIVRAVVLAVFRPRFHTFR
jgi:hypothetical protein